MAKKKSAAAKKAASGSGPDFETALAEVQQIVERLESGELGLTDSLEQYEIGIKRLKQCHALLEQAERRVTLLSGIDEDGNPFGEQFEIEENKGSARKTSQPKKRRRSTEGGSQASVDDLPGLF